MSSLFSCSFRISPFTFSVCYCCAAHPLLRSFPSRRSSDLLLGDDPGLLRCDVEPHVQGLEHVGRARCRRRDRKSTRLNSSHVAISYAVFCLKKKNKKE